MKILKNMKMKFIQRKALLILALLLVFIPMVVLTSTLVFASHSRVNLLTTENFAVLGGSAVTGTNTNVVNGDVGLDPTGGASITLLTCAEMASGTIYDNNGGYAGGGGGSTACRVTNAGLLTTAKNDLVTAYNDAAGRTTTSTIGTELGGTTLTDGTYDSAAGTFGITGTLTLNGQGNADAVFIFKMASTLITASSSNVVLTNGAQACNVYWQVGSSATLGTSTTLVGNVLALTSITDDGGSTVNGRLLARNGATTLNNTTLQKQTCAAGTAGGPPAAVQALTAAGGSGGSGGSAAPYCPPLASTIVAPFIIESRRVSPTSIFFSWGPQSGTDRFNVQYGFEHGKWLYNVDVTGFSTTINGLPANQPIWVQIAARNNCRVGGYGVSKLIGGPALPNTGIAPKTQNIPWNILVTVLGIAGLLTLLGFPFLIQRKYRISFKS